jgi:glycine cleavage system H lipoate-binding protein
MIVFMFLRRLTKLNKLHFKNMSFKTIIQTKKYINEYEWEYKENDYYKIGITNKALEELNELVYVEPLYNNGDIIESGSELCVIESVKASDSLDSPFKCEMIEFNESLEDCLDNVNETPLVPS